MPLKIFPNSFNRPATSWPAAGDRIEDFVELPTGIFTSAGIWFHTSEDLLREFANDVIDRIGINKILKEASLWTTSQDAVGAICLLGLLFTTDPALALLIALTVYLFWFSWSPVLVFPSMSPVILFLSHSLVQGVLFIVTLSILARDEQFMAVGVGLFGFILIRWGVLKRLALALTGRINADTLPREDRILRTLLLRYAISLGITLPSLEPYENRIREIWLRGKQH